MINPVYPEHPFRIQKDGEKARIFDEFRKKWVALTPEEWVRQNFLQWMTTVHHYPASMIAIEKEIRLFELNKRFDILVYDQQHHPWMMVECKANTVPLTERTLMQVLRYNMAVPVPYLVMTNGSHCRAIHRNGDAYTEITDLPAYN
jgi:hypothetical protein